MAGVTTKRPSLGQIASLGSLYDSRTESFIGVSLLKHPTPANSINTTQKPHTDIKFHKSETYHDKFNSLGLDAKLAASFLAGLVQVEGSARYLEGESQTDRVVQCSLHYSTTTVNESLNLISQGVRDNLAFQALETDLATHFVAEITWGASCIVTAKQHLNNAIGADDSEIAGRIEGYLRFLGGGDINAERAKSDWYGQLESTLDFSAYCDTLVPDTLPTDSDGIQKFIKDIPRYTSQANEGKGVPQLYTLMPLSVLGIFRILEIKVDTVLHELNLECLEKFTRLFEDISEARRSLNSYLQRLKRHNACIPRQHITDTEKKLRDISAFEISLRSKYGHLLTDVRSGRAEHQSLWNLLRESQENIEANLSGETPSTTYFQQKMEFMDLVLSKGGLYIGYDGSSIENALANSALDDAFVFFFNKQAVQDSVSWEANRALLFEFLHDPIHGDRQLVVAADCDAIGRDLDKSRISKFRNGILIVDDILERRKALAENCLMRYPSHSIDRTIKQKPLQRRAVKLPCPSPHCDKTLQCAWICSECQNAVEYGFIDDQLYCNCGSCRYDQWELRCKQLEHGTTWHSYPKEEMKRLLDNLDSFPELNILVLGESGVGKSTWINAFVNYLAHDTLYDALDHVEQNSGGELRWVVPCSFTTQVVAGDGTFIQKKIQVGSSDTERDGSKGDSATQQTKVYAFDIGKTRVRLIDTPGICDTRGLEQDTENMSDILRVLRSYNKLHGALILLKPNNSRLNAMFRFCIKQLLTHLHRNAATNIVFGFTNTRGSNYKPGDTFKPLESLLKEYEEVDLGLFGHNVYCFDSESFRYLAAHNQGVEMGYEEDFARSWEHSVVECKRLIKHLETLQPHEVRSTINLNETRNMIIRLTQPITHIAQKIQHTIQVNQEHIEELHKRKLTKEELQKRLYVQIESLESVPVDMPRTPKTYIMTDESIEQQLGTNATQMDLQQEAIKLKERKIEEFQFEYRQVQDAAVQFGFFLKWHALVPYNDATIEYVDILIEQEKMKIAAGGNDQTLKNLQRFRRAHEEKVKVLTQSMATGSSDGVLNDEEVHQKIQMLYKLPNFGDSLRDIVTNNEKMSSSMDLMPMAFTADDSASAFAHMDSMSITSTFIGSDVGDDSTFNTYYTLRYTGFGFQAPAIPIYRENPKTGSSDTVGAPAYIVSRANDKLQLVSGDPAPDRYTILAYHKNQKIEVRDSPELSKRSKVLETVSLDWPTYTPSSKPKVINLKASSGKSYSWIRAGTRTFKLVEKSKSKHDIASDTLIAKITESPEAEGMIAISVTEEMYDQDNRGLNEEIVLVSAIGVLKKCEYEISEFGWYHGIGPSPKKNGFLSAYALSGIGGAPGSAG
ncbi:hypothetical protein Dda_9349 [Drechslerella dactyloides]|uniref:G domain-containing protein n=1 Tax=Drechslerella dactyloides TaxID=74499 RepID=A0AAD6IPE5_DREDA|nr:hypothetical protein Dda_9349 [Drechslerella dactyloides]